MKGIIFSSLMLVSLFSFAADMTSMSSNWVCTTNASSTEDEAAKAADKQMAETAKSAEDAFTFASQNCRNCTKITCSLKE